MTTELTLPEKLETLDRLEKEVHEFFGFEGRWSVLPLANELAKHWMLLDDVVVFSPNPLTEQAFLEEKDIYKMELHCRPGDKVEYRHECYTMLVVDTRTDGNKYLMIFDNAKERTDLKLKAFYREL